MNMDQQVQQRQSQLQDHWQDHPAHAKTLGPLPTLSPSPQTQAHKSALTTHDPIKRPNSQTLCDNIDLPLRTEILQTIIDHIPVMLTFYDTTARFTFFNRQFERLTGYPAGQADAIDVMAACYPDEVYRREARQFMQRAEPVWQDFEITTRWNTVLHTAWTNVRLSDDSQIGIGIDVGQRRRLEAQLEQRTRLAEKRSELLRDLWLELTKTSQHQSRQLALFLREDLQQLLVAARMRAETVKAATNDPDIKEGLHELQALLRQAVGASRTCTCDLHPPVIYAGGLRDALVWLSREMLKRDGLHVELHVQEQADTHDEPVKALFFNAIQELLCNVLQHAGVTHARVNVRREDHQLLAEVADQGKGFDPAHLKSEGGSAAGFGLFGIRETLAVLRGSLEITSSPGHGSRVVVRAPLATLATLGAHTLMC